MPEPAFDHAASGGQGRLPGRRIDARLQGHRRLQRRCQGAGGQWRLGGGRQVDERGCRVAAERYRMSLAACLATRVARGMRIPH